MDVLAVMSNRVLSAHIVGCWDREVSLVRRLIRIVVGGLEYLRWIVIGEEETVDFVKY